MRRHLTWRSLATALCALCGACAPIEGPVTVEALVSDPDAEGGARLDDVVLTTVTDLRAGQGADFDVVGGLRMVSDRVIEAAAAADSDQDMRERARGDDIGHAIAARMSFDGTRWQAEDFQTLTMFSAFAGLENAWRYAEEVGDDSGATGDAALVGLEATAVASEGLPISIMTSDNAAYAAPLDGWLLLRVALQDGVPFAMSEHILAHEYGHRFFHKNVYDTDAAFAFYKKRFGEGTEAEARAIRLTQGVDEGLADLFSLGATGDKGGIPRTFEAAGSVFAAEAARRDLEGAFADAATYAGLREQTVDTELSGGCGAQQTGDLFAQASFNFYCLGTVLARSLWDASDRDVEVLRGEVQPAVRRALSRMGEAMGESGDFDLDVLLEPIAAELPPGARRDAACAAFRDKFGELVDQERVPTCL
ncbi:MAG: hypothetical protein HYS27_16715 [Deltaproteobacteria bacterium]|nr:hypothetical protein [Deltaproteobacteria bacterium]